MPWMEKNVGGIDRSFRIGIGFPSLVVAFVIEGLLFKVIFGLVALVGLATWLTGYCPLNDALDRDTAPKP